MSASLLFFNRAKTDIERRKRGNEDREWKYGYFVQVRGKSWKYYRATLKENSLIPIDFLCILLVEVKDFLFETTWKGGENHVS